MGSSRSAASSGSTSRRTTRSRPVRRHFEKTQQPAVRVVRAYGGSHGQTPRRRARFGRAGPSRCRPRPGRRARSPASAHVDGAQPGVGRPARLHAASRQAVISSRVTMELGLERRHPEPPQCREVPDRAEPRGHVLRQHADVGALGALDVELDVRSREGRRARGGTARCARAARGTLSPRRASSYSRSPSCLSALTIGGIWSLAPSRSASTRVTVSASSAGTSARLTTAPCASPVSVAAPRRRRAR